MKEEEELIHFVRINASTVPIVLSEIALLGIAFIECVQRHDLPISCN